MNSTKKWELHPKKPLILNKTKQNKCRKTITKLPENLSQMQAQVPANTQGVRNWPALRYDVKTQNWMAA